MLIKLTTTMVGWVGWRKRKKNLKETTDKSKYKNNKCFSWVSAVSILSLAGSHSPPHLPRMPSNTAGPTPCSAGGKVLGPLPQPHCPWVSIMVLSPPLQVGHPLGFAPEAALEDLGLPLWGLGVDVEQVLGLQGPWQYQVFSGVGT